ncbi:MAG TPA: GNAT family N-acetyltransferase [Fimbriimonadaceae bacterium]|jgi:GNAT superfamily N-acetyltransferase
MNLELLSATPGHFEIAVGLMREFYAHFEDLHFDEERSTAALHALIENSALGMVLLLRVDNVFVGYAALAYGFNLELFGRTAWIDEFYIRESYRGQGLGSSILDQIYADCQKEGFKALMLELDKANLDGLRLYTRKRFKPRSIYEVYVRPLED